LVLAVEQIQAVAILYSQQLLLSVEVKVAVASVFQRLQSVDLVEVRHNLQLAQQVQLIKD
jgi:hypothetical protein